MKSAMSPRARVLAAINRLPVDRVPTDIWATGEVWAKLRAHFGEGVNINERLHIDGFGGVGPKYVGPPLPAVPEGETVDMWGMRSRAMAYECGGAHVGGVEPVGGRPRVGLQVVNRLGGGEGVEGLLGVDPALVGHGLAAHAPHIHRFALRYGGEWRPEVLGTDAREAVNVEQLVDVGPLAEVGAELGPDLARGPDVGRHAVHGLVLDGGEDPLAGVHCVLASRPAAHTGSSTCSVTLATRSFTASR